MSIEILAMGGVRPTEIPKDLKQIQTFLGCSIGMYLESGNLARWNSHGGHLSDSAVFAYTIGYMGRDRSVSGWFLCVRMIFLGQHSAILSLPCRKIVLFQFHLTTQETRSGCLQQFLCRIPRKVLLVTTSISPSLSFFCKSMGQPIRKP